MTPRLNKDTVSEPTLPAELQSWRMVAANAPLELTHSLMPVPEKGEVILAVEACGLCHTDVGFLYGGVRPNAPLPLTLGHEIIGVCVAAGANEQDRVGQRFLVPAVLPCGNCELCEQGRGNVCRRQKMPGNDFHGGFASHFLTEARFLCPVPDTMTDIEGLSVVADAVGTSYQAVLRADVRQGSLVIVVGLGGVGTFAVQAAKMKGARVVGIDVADERLESLAPWLDMPVNAASMDLKETRLAVRAFEKNAGLPPHSRRIFECSGTAAGQKTAYSLLHHDAKLAVVGFTLDKIELRLANLMAFDATVFGNWGCLPEHFPELLSHIEAGRIVVEPFVERIPMSRLNELLKGHAHPRRPVLIPDFE